VARLSGLGRGLGALIPTDGSGQAAGGEGAAESILVEIPVGDIEPNPHQPRVHFDEETLSDLAASIREIGVLQPILVRQVADGQYQLVAGERRWRAARRAGLAMIPAIVRDTDDLSSVERALVENLHRQDLTALEEASAYQQLIEDFGLTHDQVSTRVGKSRSAVTNTLRLLQLPPAIQHLVADGRLSAGHARAMLGTSDRAFQELLARRVVQEGLSVRAVEDAVRDREHGTGAIADASVSDVDDQGDDVSTRTRTGLRPPGLLELEHLLAEHLETKVSVGLSGKRGRISIDFADLDDLERIYRRMTEGPEERL
jgi:ParB family transcriptional regulator, chromosome partitioning protein